MGVKNILFVKPYRDIYAANLLSMCRSLDNLSAVSVLLDYMELHGSVLALGQILLCHVFVLT